MQGIAFYPDIRYDGRKVHPEHWEPHNTQPFLRCHMYEIASTVVIPGFDEARAALENEVSRRHVDADDPLLLKWKNLLRQQQATVAKLRSELMADGWEDGGVDAGLKKYIHVNELEKIESTPPEGSF